MTKYKGPNAFSDGKLALPKKPAIIKPYVPSVQSFKSGEPAFNNRFPKSRYRGGGQSGLVPVLEVAGGGGGETFVLQLDGLNLQLGGLTLTLTVP
jgi:hypothetical protein